MSSMRTRGALGFKIDGELKLTENQFDSMPSKIGKDLLRWVLGQKDWKYVQTLARNTELHDGDIQVSDADVKRLKDKIELKSDRSWSQALGGLRFPESLTTGVMVDASRFPEDSLSCEWVYIIDLDRERLDVYLGYQTEDHDDGEFADKGSRTAPDGQTFWPTRLICGWYFDGLPSAEEFVKMTERRAVDQYKKLTAAV